MRKVLVAVMTLPSDVHNSSNDSTFYSISWTEFGYKKWEGDKFCVIGSLDKSTYVLLTKVCHLNTAGITERRRRLCSPKFKCLQRQFIDFVSLLINILSLL